MNDPYDDFSIIADEDGVTHILNNKRFECMRIEPEQLTFVYGSPNGPQQILLAGRFDPAKVARCMPPTFRFAADRDVAHLVARNLVTHIVHDNDKTLKVFTKYGAYNCIVSMTKQQLKAALQTLGRDFFTATARNPDSLPKADLHRTQSLCFAFLHVNAQNGGVTCEGDIWIDNGNDYPDYILVCEDLDTMRRRLKAARCVVKSEKPPEPSP